MAMIQNSPTPQESDVLPGEPELESKFEALSTVNDLRGKPDSSRTRRRRNRIDTPGLLQSADSSTRKAFALRRGKGKRKTAGKTGLAHVVVAAQQAQSKLGRWVRGATGLWVLGVSSVLCAGFLTYCFLYLFGG